MLPSQADAGPRKLLIATTNFKKQEEIQFLLEDLPIETLCLLDIPGFQEVAEDGRTFGENARRKAEGYAAQTGLLTLAEDSGLCCDALEDAPGVYSARFAGPGKSDEKNNQKLLKLLENVPDNCRGASFHSVIALAEPGKLVGLVEGVVHGVISREVRGMNGFGYDPVFFYPPFGRTFGEVLGEMKHRVSHRAQAMQKAKVLLAGYLEGRGTRAR